METEAYSLIDSSHPLRVRVDGSRLFLLDEGFFATVSAFEGRFTTEALEPFSVLELPPGTYRVDIRVERVADADAA
jgi:hypothetical protein